MELKVDRLLREFYPYIHRLAFSILDDIHDADDITQEFFIAAHRSLVGFRRESNPITWLYVQPMCVFTGHFDHGRHFIAQVQALPDEYL